MRFCQTPPLMIQGSMWKRKWKDYRCQVAGSMEIVSSRDNRSDEHTNAWYCDNIHKACTGSSHMGLQHWGRGVDMVSTSSDKGKPSFLQWSLLDISVTLQVSLRSLCQHKRSSVRFLWTFCFNLLCFRIPLFYWFQFSFLCFLGVLYL